MLTVETTMRDDDDDEGGAAVIRGGGLGLLCERRGAGECMKPRPRIEKPRPAWRTNYSSSSRSCRSSMALDCLVEVALSPAAAVLSLDLSGRHTVGESVAALRIDNKPSSTSTRPDGQGDEAKGKDDDDDAAMGRYNWSCSSSAVKAPAMAPSPSPGFYQLQHQRQQQRQRQEEQKLKLKRGLSSWTTAMSHPAGRSSSSSSSSLRVHAGHPHSKRFTPRFKSVLDISC